MLLDGAAKWLCCAVLPIACVTGDGWGAVLVKDGKPAVTVVLPEVTELDRYLDPSPAEVEAYLNQRFPNAPAEVISAARERLPKHRQAEATRTGDEEELALEELVLYVEKISGATLPVVRLGGGTELPAGPKVLLGAELARKAGFGKDLDKLDQDGFILRQHEGGLVVSGRRARGTLYAAYELLEALGCRWVIPGPAGEIIPRSADLAVDLDRTENPSHSKRYWWATYSEGEHYRRWTLRNKGNLVRAIEDQAIAQSHALSRPLKWGADGERGLTVRRKVRQWKKDDQRQIVRDRDGRPIPEMVEQDVRQLPDEYYAMHHGEPRYSTPNMSNPDVWRLFAEYYLDFFSDRGLFEDYASISAEDGLVLDDREATRELDSGEYDWTLGKPSATDRLWFFHNRFIEHVERVFPTRKFGVLVYANNMTPPRLQRIHPKMALVFAPLSICPLHHVRDAKCRTNRAYRDWLVAWMAHARAAGAETYYYDYDPMGFQWNDFMICPQWPIIAENYPWFHELGLDGHTAQGHDGWASTAFNHWLMIRLYWDAEADPGRILADYCRIRFGRAAPAVLDYLAILETRMAEIPDMCANEIWDNHLILSPEVRADCREALARAEKLVEQGEPREQLDMLTAIQQTTDMFCDGIEHARETGDFAGAARQIEKVFGIRDKMNKTVYSHFYQPERTDPEQRRAYLAGGWHRKYLTWAAKIRESAAHVILPRMAKIAPDTDCRSSAGRWYLPETDVSDLPDGDTTLIPDVTYQTQREPAAFFYRTRVRVPDSFRGKKRIVLYFPSLIARKMQIWVNGEPVLFDHGSYKSAVWSGAEYFWTDYNHQHAFDLGDRIKPGQENVIAFRVFKTYDHGGSYDRIFLLADPPEDL